MTRVQAPPSRITAVDVVRGVAIFGTLGTNIWMFTDPNGPAALLPAADPSTFAGAVETALRTLANGKFLALLTLLFGVGLELQYRSALRRGARWPGRYLWRAALLFVEGLLHYLLIFEFDVLMSYAVTSVLVAHLIGRSERAVNRWIGAMTALHLAFIGLVTAALLGRSAALRTEPTDLYSHGSWPAQVAARADQWLAYRLEAIFIVPMSIALFLLGAKLHRAGVFAAGGQRLRNRLMLVGFGVGAPLNLLTAVAGPGWFMVDRYVLPPLVALGLLGLIPSLVRGTGPLHRGVTSVGRTALSCYVFQNLVAATLCYGWGLGLAVRLEAWRPWWTITAWALICTALMLLSTWWLRHHRRGPLEAAWHWAYQLPRRAGR
ncbi:DUF418 domain-containing protein [Saccharopolyspora griseoalba]|uniref:DUF418 domain-containing protein n=1 Tax=Saccharopolyspora griseoalba TaxID=1431848 RepID=A0ABW2LK22_9PSEU